MAVWVPETLASDPSPYPVGVPRHLRFLHRMRTRKVLDFFPAVDTQAQAASIGASLDRSDPAQTRDRVLFFDEVRGPVVPDVGDGPGRLISGAAGVQATFEVVRMLVPARATTVVERIGTYARLMRDGDVLLLMEGGPTVGTDQVADPFPFPLAHPGGVGAGLSITWHLFLQRIASDALFYPPIVGPVGPPSVTIPRGENLMPPWSDMRYTWSGFYSDHMKYVIGGRGLLRMFATISVAPSPANPTLGWTVAVGGRLSGYTAKIGTNGSALNAATRRT